MKKRIRKLESQNEFWRGVRSCAMWAGGTLIGTAAFIYYLLEIIKSVKELGC